MSETLLKNLDDGVLLLTLNRPKRKNALGLFPLMCMVAIDPKLRSVLWAFLVQCARNPLNVFRKAAVQPITVVVPPHFVDGKRDLCDACPDAMLHEGVNRNFLVNCVAYLTGQGALIAGQKFTSSTIVRI